jgi:hypothetical protein
MALLDCAPALMHIIELEVCITSKAATMPAAGAQSGK